MLGAVGIFAAIYWSLMGVEMGDVFARMGEADLVLIAGVLLMTTLNLLIRAAVWKAIVRPMKSVSLYNAFTSYLVGVFSNLFLPFKLGDVAQGYSLGRKTAINKFSLVTTVLVQRVFEIASLLIIMVIIAALFSFPMLLERRNVVLVITVVLAIAFLVLLTFFKEQVITWVERRLQVISPSFALTVKRGFYQFIDGTRAINSLSDITRILTLSFLSWLVQITMALLMAWSLDIRIDFISASIVLLVINIGLLIPIAPGNIGTFQFFSIIALSWFSVAKSKALTFAILFQVVQGIPVIMGGGLSMMMELFADRYRSEKNRNSNTDKTETTV